MRCQTVKCVQSWSLKGEEGGLVEKFLKEIMSENFPYFMKNINLKIQKFSEPQIRKYYKTTLKYITVQLLKINNKEKYVDRSVFSIAV